VASWGFWPVRTGIPGLAQVIASDHLLWPPTRGRGHFGGRDLVSRG
jgi:hypothetical protein